MQLQEVTQRNFCTTCAASPNNTVQYPNKDINTDIKHQSYVQPALVCIYIFNSVYNFVTCASCVNICQDTAQFQHQNPSCHLFIIILTTLISP